MKPKPEKHWSLGSSRIAVRSLAVTLILIFATLTAKPAAAQKYKVLHTFTGGADGGQPLFVKLIRDASGNLYGTTQLGGTAGHGTVFRLDSRGKETVLYSFSGGFDGASPAAGLVRDKAGNLYGTTQGGGSPCFEGEGGCGVVFELTAAGQYVLLHSFLGVIGGGDGGFPNASLLRDTGGNLYGTTTGGGISTAECQEGAGTVFKMEQADGSWTEILLYSFSCTGADGMFPYGSLIAGLAGSLYGTTTGGGTCGGAGLDRCGTVFELRPRADGWTHAVHHGFAGGADGAALWDGLVRDSLGNFYGTTQLGGAFGFGTIFRLDASFKKTVLHSFTGSDGAYPIAGLVRDKAGNLYGTAKEGGTSLVGTVFRLDSAGNLTVLHNFTGGSDGAYPFGPLLRVGAALYGTTNAGGAQNMGTVFRLSP